MRLSVFLVTGPLSSLYPNVCGNHEPASRHLIRCSLTNCRASWLSSSRTWLIGHWLLEIDDSNGEERYIPEVVAPCILVRELKQFDLQLAQSLIVKLSEFFLNLLKILLTRCLPNHLFK